MTNELAEKPMSYEEMIDTLKGLVFGTFDRTTSKERDALSRAIDLLSNLDESIIDKIRAEITDTGAYEQEVNGRTEFLKGIEYCLNIIDKYKQKVRNKE